MSLSQCNGNIQRCLLFFISGLDVQEGDDPLTDRVLLEKNVSERPAHVERTYTTATIAQCNAAEDPANHSGKRFVLIFLNTHINLIYFYRSTFLAHEANRQDKGTPLATPFLHIRILSAEDR